MYDISYVVLGVTNMFCIVFLSTDDPCEMTTTIRPYNHPRGWHFSASGSPIKGFLKPFEHHDNNVPKEDSFVGA